MGLRSKVALCLLLAVIAVPLATSQSKSQLTAITRVRSEPDSRFLIEDAPTFPIGFTLGPPRGATSPEGIKAMEELPREGFVFEQWICPKKAWGPEREAQLDALLREANQRGMHIAISFADLQQVDAADVAR